MDRSKEGYSFFYNNEKCVLIRSQLGRMRIDGVKFNTCVVHTFKGLASGKLYVEGVVPKSRLGLRGWS